jgi:hypothetical protein
MHIFGLRKNKATGHFVEESTVCGFVACSFAQPVSPDELFCTSFVDKIVSNDVDST